MTTVLQIEIVQYDLYIYFRYYLVLFQNHLKWINLRIIIRINLSKYFVEIPISSSRIYQHLFYKKINHPDPLATQPILITIYF
jgi:hypothetical protein